MTMTATVLEVNPRSLLVRNEANGEEVLVLTNNASQYSVGDRIRITFNGQMTFSIPPQISAQSIQRLNPAPPSSGSSEMRAEITQRGRDFLIVRNTQNRQQFRVEYPHANHFCVRQRVLIRYNTIEFTNPPTITATEITPIC